MPISGSQGGISSAFAHASSALGLQKELQQLEAGRRAALRGGEGPRAAVPAG